MPMNHGVDPLSSFGQLGKPSGDGHPTEGDFHTEGGHLFKGAALLGEPLRASLPAVAIQPRCRIPISPVEGCMKLSQHPLA